MTASPHREDKIKRLQNNKILIVDDHRNIRFSLKLTLEDEGALVSEAEDCETALKSLGAMTTADAFPYHLILLDIRLPDGNGLDILKRLSDIGMSSRVIMISGEGTVTEAFQATQMGAFDYIEKPFTPERILVSVRRCLDFNRIQTQNETLTKQVMKGQEIIGSHASVVSLHEMIARVAPTNGRILIHGESGTGKELVAKAVHRSSERSEKPLIKVNCAAIPHSLIESELFGHEKGAFTGAIKTRKGLFEQAHQGTLFLDEIGELSLDVQAKLLRVLQNGELSRVGSEKIIVVDVRLIAATHRDLEEMVQNGEFREDLFYRLNVLTLEVPTLRERLEDLPELANHFLETACDENSLGYRSFSAEAMGQMSAYHWPGNIRELKNRVERAAILSETPEISSIEDLGADAPRNAVPVHRDIAQPDGGDEGGFMFQTSVVPWQEFHAQLDRQYLEYVLRKTGGNVSEASRVLCLERAYLHRLMKKLGVQRDVVVSAK